MRKRAIKLNPSDLTFLWDECKRCFYLKYVHGINRPAIPFPSIFGTIDRLLKEHFHGKSTEYLDPSIPPGVVRYREKWVESAPLSFHGHSRQVFIRGKFDTVIAFEDGSFGIVDFKTSVPSSKHIPFYSRQLHAYAIALEQPAPKKLALYPVSKLGLLAVTPDAMNRTASGQIAYLGKVTWMEIPRNDEVFIGFLEEVLTLLEQPEPPEASPNCGYCLYRAEARQHGF